MLFCLINSHTNVANVTMNLNFSCIKGVASTLPVSNPNVFNFFQASHNINIYFSSKSVIFMFIKIILCYRT